MFTAAATPNPSSLTPPPLTEVVGIYETDEELDIALRDLVDAGFSSAQFGLMASKAAVREQLSEVYREVVSEISPMPNVEFIGKPSSGSNIPLRLGGLGTLRSTPAETEVVASRSVLINAALSVSTGVIKRFPTGVAALTDANALEAKMDTTPIVKPVAEALVDDRLLLMVSEQDKKKITTAREVLELSDSMDEGIIALETTLASATKN